VADMGLPPVFTIYQNMSFAQCIFDKTVFIMKMLLELPMIDPIRSTCSAILVWDELKSSSIWARCD
jgi:hypothetical protein